jgi:hypothetical protein
VLLVIKVVRIGNGDYNHEAGNCTAEVRGE